MQVGQQARPAGIPAVPFQATAPSAPAPTLETEMTPDHPAYPVTFSKNQFQKLWGSGGYTETFAHNVSMPDLMTGWIKGCTTCFEKALDIGCGSGAMTKRILAPLFAEVVAIDLLPALPQPCRNVRYLELAESDYTCGGLPDGYFDFVYCHGVFCHLPNSATATYLKNIRRVLKPASHAIVMVPECNRYAGSAQPAHREIVSSVGWHYYDTETAQRLAAEAGFSVTDLYPSNRDLIMLLTQN